MTITAAQDCYGRHAKEIGKRMSRIGGGGEDIVHELFADRIFTFFWISLGFFDVGTSITLLSNGRNVERNKYKQ